MRTKNLTASKTEDHVLLNVDSRDQPVEILLIRYDKRNKKLELLSDQYVCDSLIEIRDIVRQYLKRRESLMSVTVDSAFHTREHLRDLKFMCAQAANQTRKKGRGKVK